MLPSGPVEISATAWTVVSHPAALDAVVSPPGPARVPAPRPG
jgi:hypothetical protein